VVSLNLAHPVYMLKMFEIWQNVQQQPVISIG